MALMIVFVAAAGLLPLGIVAFSTSENQGHLSARASEYAQDKLEQLMALSYGDTTSDTRVFPALDSAAVASPSVAASILLPRSRCMWTTWISMER